MNTKLKEKTIKTTLIISQTIFYLCCLNGIFVEHNYLWIAIALAGSSAYFCKNFKTSTYIFVVLMITATLFMK